MIYLVTLIALVILAVLLWKAFGPDTSAPPAERVLGPDDDPEFLWRMNRRAHASDREDGDQNGGDQGVGGFAISLNSLLVIFTAWSEPSASLTKTANARSPFDP